MGKDVTCCDCSAKRRNAAYSNTRYCKSCRLLRDLTYLADRTKSCDECKATFAPASRRDAYCGKCCFGSLDVGTCAFCKRSDAELHRQGIPVCCQCLRLPTLRRQIIAGLQRGQRERRLEHAHV